IELLTERDLLVRRTLDSVSQELAQPRDHAPNAAWIPLHERRDGVQGIEEKMRIQLHAERVEARFGELRSKLRRHAKRLLTLRAIPKRVRACNARGEHAEVRD